jgi:hypothetical protein
MEKAERERERERDISRRTRGIHNSSNKQTDKEAKDTAGISIQGTETTANQENPKGNK